MAKALAEMVIQFELGYEDLALTRLKAVDRLLRERFPATTIAPKAAEAPNDSPDDADAAPMPVGGPFQYVLHYLALVRAEMQRPDPERPAAPKCPSRHRRTHRCASPPARRFAGPQFLFLAPRRAEHRQFYEVLLEVATDRGNKL